MFLPARVSKAEPLGLRESVSLRCVRLRVCSYLRVCVDGGAALFKNITGHLLPTVVDGAARVAACCNSSALSLFLLVLVFLKVFCQMNAPVGTQFLRMVLRTLFGTL